MQVTLLPTGDTTIYSDSPTNNYGTNSNLQVGEYNASVSVSRSLILFDLSAYVGKVLTSAKLRLYNTGVDATNNARTMYANRMVRAWTELGATWNKYDGTNNWATAGGMTNAADVELANIGTVSVTNPPTAGWHEITLTTSAIQAWIDGTYDNNGFGISMGTETDDMQEFHSRENANPPELVIVYPDPSDIIIPSFSTSIGTIYKVVGY